MSEDQLNQFSADVRGDSSRWNDWQDGFQQGVSCAADLLADYVERFESENDRKLFLEIILHTKAIEPLVIP